MQIIVNIQLQPDDTVSFTADEVAAKVLEALGGDEETDHCMAQIANVPEMAQIGATPIPPVV